MDRLNSIYNHPVYRAEADALAEDEKDRIFCKHGVDHLLEVARLCYLYCLENGLINPAKVPEDQPVTREMVYAAALLHDIGRHQQYANGIPHDEAGASIAESVLRDVGFAEHEIRIIINAIAKHRTGEHLTDEELEHFGVSDELAAYLARADKKSRRCFACDARSECNWPEEKMNLRIDK